MNLSKLAREQEAKFRVTDTASCDLLLTSLLQQGYHAEELGEAVEQDTYLDTPSFDLVRQGLTVRRRRAQTRVTLGIKGLSTGRGQPIHDRIDFAAPLEPDADISRPDAWPHAIREALASILPPDAYPTVPIAHLHQTRRRQRISAPGADHPVAEWSLDDVSVFAPEPNGDLRPVSTFSELELERLPDGDAEQFLRLVELVRADAALPPLAESKLERALLALPGEDAGVTPELDVAEACRRILYRQFIAILVCEHGVRSGDDPEYVHDMRVAIRRARAAIRLFAPHFRQRSLRPQVNGLRRLGQALGAVRDLDVALANLALFKKEQPKGERKEVKPLRRQTEAARTKARVALLDLLDSNEQRAWLVDFARFCLTPGRGVRKIDVDDHTIPPRQVRHTFPSVILSCFEAVRAYEDAFGGDDLPGLPTFHSLRIACKYLRYSLEFARHLMGEPGEQLIDQLRLLQDQLGNINDAHVESDRLAAWATELAATTAFDARRAALAERITDLTTAFPARYAHFIDGENRMILGAALARL